MQITPSQDRGSFKYFFINKTNKHNTLYGYTSSEIWVFSLKEVLSMLLYNAIIFLKTTVIMYCVNDGMM